MALVLKGENVELSSSQRWFSGALITDPVEFVPLYMSAKSLQKLQGFNSNPFIASLSLFPHSVSACTIK